VVQTIRGAGDAPEASRGASSRRSQRQRSAAASVTARSRSASHSADSLSCCTASGGRRRRVRRAASAGWFTAQPACTRPMWQRPASNDPVIGLAGRVWHHLDGSWSALRRWHRAPEARTGRHKVNGMAGLTGWCFPSRRWPAERALDSRRPASRASAWRSATTRFAFTRPSRRSA